MTITELLKMKTVGLPLCLEITTRLAVAVAVAAQA